MHVCLFNLPLHSMAARKVLDMRDTVKTLDIYAHAKCQITRKILSKLYKVLIHKERGYDIMQVVYLGIIPHIPHLKFQ